jgi:hypothetical protein
MLAADDADAYFARFLAPRRRVSCRLYVAWSRGRVLEALKTNGNFCDMMRHEIDGEWVVIRTLSVVFET